MTEKMVELMLRYLNDRCPRSFKLASCWQAGWNLRACIFSDPRYGCSFYNVLTVYIITKGKFRLRDLSACFIGLFYLVGVDGCSSGCRGSLSTSNRLDRGRWVVPSSCWIPVFGCGWSCPSSSSPSSWESSATTSRSCCTVTKRWTWSRFPTGGPQPDLWTLLGFTSCC